MFVGEMAFEELDQIVREAQKARLHLLRDGSAGPSPLLAEFVFEFIENFFNIPTAEIDEGDHAGRERAFAGEECVNFSGGGVRVADAAQGDAFAGHDVIIGGDADVIRVLTVNRAWARDGQDPLFFGQGNKIATAGLFPFLPLGIVDGGTVVGLEHFSSSGGVVAKLVEREAFEHVHIVFLFALAEGERAEGLGAQVEGEEVASRAFAAVDRGVRHGRPGPVAIGGVDIIIVQVGEMSAGVVGELSGATLTGLLTEREAAGAFERLEKMSARGTMRELRADALEEGAAAGLIVERADRAEEQPILIRKRRAGPEGGTLGRELRERREEG